MSRSGAKYKAIRFTNFWDEFCCSPLPPLQHAQLVYVTLTRFPNILRSVVTSDPNMALLIGRKLLRILDSEASAALKIYTSAALHAFMRSGVGGFPVLCVLLCGFSLVLLLFLFFLIFCASSFTFSSTNFFFFCFPSRRIEFIPSAEASQFLSECWASFTQTSRFSLSDFQYTSRVLLADVLALSQSMRIEGVTVSSVCSVIEQVSRRCWYCSSQYSHSFILSPSSFCPLFQPNTFDLNY